MSEINEINEIDERNEQEIIEAEERFITLQKTVSRAANRAVIFSLLWFGGIGSAFAVYFGFKCLQLLKTHAEEELKGKGKALFGIALGIIGILFFIVWWFLVITGRLDL